MSGHKSSAFCLHQLVGVKHLNCPVSKKCKSSFTQSNVSKSKHQNNQKGKSKLLEYQRQKKKINHIIFYMDNVCISKMLQLYYAKCDQNVKLINVFYAIILNFQHIL